MGADGIRRGKRLHCQILLQLRRRGKIQAPVPLGAPLDRAVNEAAKHNWCGPLPDDLINDHSNTLSCDTTVRLHTALNVIKRDAGGNIGLLDDDEVTSIKVATFRNFCAGPSTETKQQT